MAAQDRQSQPLRRASHEFDAKPGFVPRGPLAGEQTCERSRRERRSRTRERRPRKVPARQRAICPPGHHPPGEPFGFIQQVSPWG